MQERAQQQLEAISQIHAILAEVTGESAHEEARHRMLEVIAAAAGYQYALLAEQETDQPTMKVTAVYFPPRVSRQIEKTLGFNLLGYRFPNDPKEALKTPPVEVFRHAHDYFPRIPSAIGLAVDKLVGIKSIALIRQHPGELYLGAVTFVAVNDGYDQSLLEYLCNYHLSFALRLLREQAEHLRLRARYTEELEKQVEERSIELKQALNRSLAAEEKLGDLNLHLANTHHELTIRLKESEALLNGLRVLSETFDEEQIFAKTLTILGEALNFEHAFIMKEDKGNFVVVASTHPVFTTTVWQAREFLRRIMTGKSQAVFDINQVPEWLDLPPETRALATSALYIPLRPIPNAAILVCIHGEQGFFTSQHQTLARRFALLAAQALQNAELYAALKMERNNLETRVMERTAELQRERDFGLLVMESMGEGLTITKADGIFEYVNPAYARYLQRAPEEIIGHSPEDFTEPNDRSKLAEAWNLRMGGKSTSYETNLVARDGSHIRVIVTAVPRLRNGEFAGSIAVVTDVSERARLEQMKTDFINRASHELRTPLTTAILMADLLEGGGNAEEQKDFLTILKQELNRQRTLLNDLLMAGRIESGRAVYHLAPTEMTTLVEESIASVKPQAEAKQITITFDHDVSLPLVNTDRQALLQILLNLLSNAIKFSRAESRVEIQAQNADGGVLTSVQDYGIGIPAQELPHIGTRFFRAQNAIANEIQGTGIGLYLVNEIVKGLGGWMKIESVENEGTTMHVWLPTVKHSDSSRNLSKALGED